LGVKYSARRMAIRYVRAGDRGGSGGEDRVEDGMLGEGGEGKVEKMGG